MGLTKQYLRYAATAVFGVIGSQKANITYVTLRGGERGRYVAVAACEHVFIWDVRKAEKVRLEHVLIALGASRYPVKTRYSSLMISSHLSLFFFCCILSVQVLILQGQKHEVSFLCPSPDGVHIAVGYEDGAVRIFSLLNGESNISFNGHKSAVSVMKYDALGARLVTGSKVKRGKKKT